MQASTDHTASPRAGAQPSRSQATSRTREEAATTEPLQLQDPQNEVKTDREVRLQARTLRRVARLDRDAAVGADSTVDAHTGTPRHPEVDSRTPTSHVSLLSTASHATPATHSPLPRPPSDSPHEQRVQLHHGEDHAPLQDPRVEPRRPPQDTVRAEIAAMRQQLQEEVRQQVAQQLEDYLVPFRTAVDQDISELEKHLLEDNRELRQRLLLLQQDVQEAVDEIEHLHNELDKAERLAPSATRALDPSSAAKALDSSAARGLGSGAGVATTALDPSSARGLGSGAARRAQRPTTMHSALAYDDLADLDPTLPYDTDVHTDQDDEKDTLGIGMPLSEAARVAGVTPGQGEEVTAEKLRQLQDAERARFLLDLEALQVSKARLELDRAAHKAAADKKTHSKLSNYPAVPAASLALMRLEPIAAERWRRSTLTHLDAPGFTERLARGGDTAHSCKAEQLRHVLATLNTQALMNVAESIKQDLVQHAPDGTVTYSVPNPAQTLISKVWRRAHGGANPAMIWEKRLQTLCDDMKAETTWVEFFTQVLNHVTEVHRAHYEEAVDKATHSASGSAATTPPRPSEVACLGEAVTAILSYTGPEYSRADRLKFLAQSDISRYSPKDAVVRALQRYDEQLLLLKQVSADTRRARSTAVAAAATPHAAVGGEALGAAAVIKWGYGNTPGGPTPSSASKGPCFACSQTGHTCAEWQLCPRQDHPPTHAERAAFFRAARKSADPPGGPTQQQQKQQQQQQPARSRGQGRTPNWTPKAGEATEVNWGGRTWHFCSKCVGLVNRFGRKRSGWGQHTLADHRDAPPRSANALQPVLIGAAEHADAGNNFTVTLVNGKKVATYLDGGARKSLVRDAAVTGPRIAKAAHFKMMDGSDFHTTHVAHVQLRPPGVPEEHSVTHEVHVVPKHVSLPGDLVLGQDLQERCVTVNYKRGRCEWEMPGAAPTTTPLAPRNDPDVRRAFDQAQNGGYPGEGPRRKPLPRDPDVRRSFDQASSGGFPGEGWQDTDSYPMHDAYFSQIVDTMREQGVSCAVDAYSSHTNCKFTWHFTKETPLLQAPPLPDTVWAWANIPFTTTHLQEATQLLDKHKLVVNAPVWMCRPASRRATLRLLDRATTLPTINPPDPHLYLIQKKGQHQNNGVLKFPTMSFAAAGLRQEAISPAGRTTDAHALLQWHIKRLTLAELVAEMLHRVPGPLPRVWFPDLVPLIQTLVHTAKKECPTEKAVTAVLSQYMRRARLSKHHWSEHRDQLLHRHSTPALQALRETTAPEHWAHEANLRRGAYQLGPSEMETELEKIPACSYCSRPATRRCRRCHMQYYCSAECSTADADAHAEECTHHRAVRRGQYGPDMRTRMMNMAAATKSVDVASAAVLAVAQEKATQLAAQCLAAEMDVTEAEQERKMAMLGREDTWFVAAARQVTSAAHASLEQQATALVQEEGWISRKDDPVDFLPGYTPAKPYAAAAVMATDRPPDKLPVEGARELAETQKELQELEQRVALLRSKRQGLLTIVEPDLKELGLPPRQELAQAPSCIRTHENETREALMAYLAATPLVQEGEAPPPLDTQAHEGTQPVPPYHWPGKYMTNEERDSCIKAFPDPRVTPEQASTQCDIVRTIVSRFMHTCLKISDGRPYCPPDRVKATIKLKDGYKVPAKAARGYSPRMAKLVDEAVVTMWERGWIRKLAPHEYSPFESPVHLARHPSDPSKPLRPTGDFRMLNAATELLRLYEAAPQVLHNTIPPNSWYVASVDGRRAYYSMMLDEESQRLCSFTWKSTQFCFTCNLPGTLNGGAWLRLALGRDMEGLTRTVLFRDDCITHATEFWDFALQLWQMLMRAENRRWVLTKLAIGGNTIDLIGKRFTVNGKLPLQAHQDRMSNHERPKTKEQMLSFLGLAGYCSEFVEHYALKVGPLHDSCRKPKEKPLDISWTPELVAAYDQVVADIVNAKALYQPRMDKPFEVWTDASSLDTGGCGATLRQRDENGKPRILAYWSYRWTSAQRKWHSYRQECFAHFSAVSKWERIIDNGFPTVCVIDAKAGVRAEDNHDPVIARMWLKLSHLQLLRQWRNRTFTVVEDHLARYAPDQDTLPPNDQELLRDLDSGDLPDDNTDMLAPLVHPTPAPLRQKREYAAAALTRFQKRQWQQQVEKQRQEQKEATEELRTALVPPLAPEPTVLDTVESKDQHMVGKAVESKEEPTVSKVNPETTVQPTALTDRALRGVATTGKRADLYAQLFDVRYGDEYDEWWEEIPRAPHGDRSHRNDKFPVALESEWAGPTPSVSEIKQAYRHCAVAQEARKLIQEYQDGGAPTRFEQNEKGLLFYRARRGVVARWLVPRPLRQLILWMAHGNLHSGHNGKDKTAYNLRGCWWPGMNDAIRRFCGGCHTCHLRASAADLHIGSLGIRPLPERFAQVHSDALGPLPRTTDGNVYILAFTDVATHTRAYWPVPELTQAVFLRALRWAWVQHYGHPRILYTDFASALGGQLVQAAAAEFGFRHTHSDSKTQAQNGLSEQGNKKVYEYLCHFSQSDRRTDWDTLIPSLVLMLNASLDPTRGTSPFYLTTLSHPRLGVEKLVRGLHEEPREQPLPLVVHQLQQEMAVAMDAVAAARTRHMFNKIRAVTRTEHEQTFQIGDMCYVVHEKGYARPADDHGPGDKLYNSNSGPWVVHGTADERPDTYRLRHLYLGTTDVVNRKRMRRFKPYIPETEPQDEEEEQETEEQALARVGEDVDATAPPKKVEKRVVAEHIQSSAPEPEPLEPEPEMKAPFPGQQVFNVERVCATRNKGRQWAALVKWAGYEDKDNTWEPADSFISVGAHGQGGLSALHVYFDDEDKYAELGRLPPRLRKAWPEWQKLRSKHARSTRTGHQRNRHPS